MITKTIEQNICPTYMKDLSITGGFWKERQDRLRDVTIQAVYDRFEETGRHEALKHLWKPGMPNEPHIFWESDIAKWIEGAAYFLAKQRDPHVESLIDELVDRFAAGQDANGYLNAYFTVVEPDARFTRRTDHELYCAGHLAEAAVAYLEATGKGKLMEVVEKYMALIEQTFCIDHSAAFDTPGHEEIELALVRLYHATGKERYRKMAEYFVDTRGTSDRDAEYIPGDRSYSQSHLPVREQTTAEGHSVRALYLYSAMADLALENNDEALFGACRALYENITEKRMYVTGGVGSTNQGEAFTGDYDLPDDTAYAETCASIALALFCRRMWLLESDGCYADTAELALYNTVLAGISLSGDEFYYENPLRTDVERFNYFADKPEGRKERLPIQQRVKVFGCSCCPPNLLRIVGSIGDFAYAVKENTIYTQCYMESDASLKLAGQTVELTQKTGYPYDGAVTITAKTAGTYGIAVRIPEWCETYTLSVNGEAVQAAPEKGFVVIDRTWQAGDEIRLALEMEVQVLSANPLIRAAAGQLCVKRGPMVYCAEGIDNPAGPIRAMRISRKNVYTVNQMEMQGFTLPIIETTASLPARMTGLYSAKPAAAGIVPLKLIPYHTWANRGQYEMSVWLPAEY